MQKPTARKLHDLHGRYEAFEALLVAREILTSNLPGEPIHGHVPDAGLPKGFVPAQAIAGE
jgi:hypothetical protein